MADINKIVDGNGNAYNFRDSEAARNTPTFSQASSRANLNGSGETMPTILGKVKKWFADLKALAFKDKVSDGDINGTLSDSHIASASTWNGKANADGSNATGTWGIDISRNAATATTATKATIASKMENPQFDENYRYLRIGSGNSGKWIKIASVTYSGTYGSGVAVITCFGRWNNVQQVQFGLKHNADISVNTFNYINVTDVTGNERIGYVQSGSTFDFWVKSKANVLVVGVATDRGQGTFGSWNVSTDIDLEGKISSSEPSGIVYASYGNFLGNAATASALSIPGNKGNNTTPIYYNGNTGQFEVCSPSSMSVGNATEVVDYGNTSLRIKIGYSGAALTSTSHLAAYTTINGQNCIKDISPSNVTVGNATKWNGYNIVVGSLSTNANTISFL